MAVKFPLTLLSPIENLVVTRLAITKSSDFFHGRQSPFAAASIATLYSSILSHAAGVGRFVVSGSLGHGVTGWRISPKVREFLTLGCVG